MEDTVKKTRKTSFIVPKQHSGSNGTGATPRTARPTVDEDRELRVATGTKKGVKQDLNVQNLGDGTKNAVCQPQKRKEVADKCMLKVKVSSEKKEAKTGMDAGSQKLELSSDQPDKKCRKNLQVTKSLTEDEYTDIFNCVLQKACSQDDDVEGSRMDREREGSLHHSAPDEEIVDNISLEQDENKKTIALAGKDWELSNEQHEEAQIDESDRNSDDDHSAISEAVDDWDEGSQSIQEENEMTPSERQPINTECVVKSCKRTEKQNRLVPKKLFIDSDSQKKAKLPEMKKNALYKKSLEPQNLHKNHHEQEKVECEEEETGTWVQCCNSTCSKWRYLSYIEDPLLVPDLWECNMSLDKEHNSCAAPEVNYDESQHILTKFTIGSIVWAKMDGFPWWPAMIESDPDYDIYFEVLTETSMVPTQYHVTFFDDHVTRAWIKTTLIAPYMKNEALKSRFLNGRHPYKKGVQAAVNNANQAMALNLQERLMKFGFTKRYSRRNRKYEGEKSLANKVPKLNKRKAVVKKAVRGKEILNVPESKTHAEETDVADVGMESSNGDSENDADISEDSLEFSEYVPVASRSRQASNDKKKNASDDKKKNASCDKKKNKLEQPLKFPSEDDELRKSKKSKLGMGCANKTEISNLKAMSLKSNQTCMGLDSEIFTMEADTLVVVEADLPDGTVVNDSVEAEDLPKDNLVQNNQNNYNKKKKFDKKFTLKPKSKNTDKKKHHKKVHIKSSSTAMEELEEIKEHFEGKPAKNSSDKNSLAEDTDEKDTVILDEGHNLKGCSTDNKLLSLKEKKLPWKPKNLCNLNLGKNGNADQDQSSSLMYNNYGSTETQMNKTISKRQNRQKVTHGTLLMGESISRNGNKRKSSQKCNKSPDRKNAVSVVSPQQGKASKSEVKPMKRKKNSEKIKLTEENKVTEVEIPELGTQSKVLPIQGEKTPEAAGKECESEGKTNKFSSDNDDLLATNSKSIDRALKNPRQNEIVKDDSDKENQDPNLNDVDFDNARENSAEAGKNKKQTPKSARAKADTKAGRKSKLCLQKKNKQDSNVSQKVDTGLDVTPSLKEVRNKNMLEESDKNQTADHKTSTRKAQKEKGTAGGNLKKVNNGSAAATRVKVYEGKTNASAETSTGFSTSVTTSKQPVVSEMFPITENVSLNGRQKFKRKAPFSSLPKNADQHVVPDIDGEVQVAKLFKKELSIGSLEGGKKKGKSDVDRGDKEQESLPQIISYDKSDEEEELDLSFDPGKVDRIVPQKILSDGGISDNDSSLDLDYHEGESKVVVEGISENEVIHGRFAGRCFEHGSDSDPLELIED